jgi:hypothetical protein
MRGRLAVGLIAVGGLVMAACTTAGEAGTSSVAATTLTTVVVPSTWPVEGTGVEGSPVLGVYTACTSMCAFADPPGLADVLVYGDGTVITSKRILRSSGDPVGVLLRTYRPSEAALADLYVAVGDAGLLEVGESVAGDSNWCADCASTVFISRLGGGLSRVNAPCMCTEADSIEGDAAAHRDLLREVQRLLGHLVPHGEGTVLEPTAYVLYVYGVSDQTAEIEATGLDLADFAELEYGALCGIVPATNPIGAAVVGSGARFSTPVRFGDEVRAVEARPAYPHEHSCADVDF